MTISTLSNLEKPIANLIIGGAPKCGTTSLFSWLVSHPSICGSNPKETHYFMDKNHPLLRRGGNYHAHGLSKYNSYFPNNALDFRFKLEASAHYLYQTTAYEYFSQFPAEVFVIFLVRKPSQMIYSAFKYLQNNRAEIDKSVDFSTFSEILFTDNMSALSALCKTNQAFEWSSKLFEYADYYKWLCKWKSTFNQNFTVFLFEDLFNNPLPVIVNLCQNLNIDPTFFLNYDFSPSNQTKNISNFSIHSFFRKAYRSLQSLYSFSPPPAFKSLYYNLQSSKLGLLNNDKSNSTRKLINSNSSDIKALKSIDEYFFPLQSRLNSEFELNIDLWN